MDWLCHSNDSEKFWDLNRTWYTDNPDFSRCFQCSVLNWIPCIYLVVASPFYFVYLRCHDCGYIRMSRLNKSKTSLGVLLVLLCYIELFYTIWNITHHIPEAPISLISPTLLGLSMVLATCLIQYERMRGVQSSGVLLFFWLLALLCALVQLRSKIVWALIKDADLDRFRYAIFSLYFVLLLAQFVLCTFSDQPPFFCDLNEEPNPNPERQASFLSRVTFHWCTGIMLKGYKHPLKEDDVWSLRKSDTADKLVPEFAKEIQRERNKRKSTEVQINHRTIQQNGESAEVEVLIKSAKMEMDWKSLAKIICKVFGFYYLLSTLFMALFTAFIFITPEILRLLLAFSEDSSSPSWQGFLYAVLLFICPCAQSLFIHQHDYICYVTGMRLKSAVMGCIYTKALVITHSGRKSSFSGEIVNLISTDIQKLMDLATCLNYLWAAPLTILLAMYILWQTLGIAVLAGVAAFCLNFPFMVIFSMKIKRFQEEQMKYKDARIKLMNEILQGIKILKLYAWESAFSMKIQDIRLSELKCTKRCALLLAAAVALFMTAIFWVSLAMFAVYLLMDEKNVLDAQKAFVTLLLLNILKMPLRFCPAGLNFAMQSLVALRRFVTFFSEEEVKPSNVDKVCTSSNEIMIQNGTFSWSAAESPCLRSININIHKGSLVAVVGHVGCGKTSLLSALLGEMEKLEGHVAVKGSVAYVPQQAWIRNATFKDNVLFGWKLEQNWYNAVVKACALLPDLKIFPAGEDTEIGEKGVNLSGGQKQRISFARAVYRKSDVYFLDDPLSAVDTHVGQYLFENVIGPKGLLKGKTRILVTHGVSFLPQMDTIIVMTDGRISEMGSYEELLQQDGAFADFIQMHTVAKQDGSIESENSIKDEKETRNDIDTQKEKAMTNEKNGKAAGTGNLTEADKAHTGRVKLAVYLEYCKFLGGFYLLLITLLYIAQQTAASCYNYWIALWADDPIVNGTQQHTQLRLGVYSFLGIVQVVGIFAASAAVVQGGVSVSQHLHSKLLHSILRCPLRFFERTPSGNLTNRFAKEMDTIDSAIPNVLMMFIMTFLVICEILLVIAVATPAVAVTFLPLGLIYFFLQRFYLASSRQLQRLESVSKSPLYTHLNETLQGIGVIRAFGEQNRFIQENHARLDTNQQLYYSKFVANRWLSVRLDFLGNCIVFSVVIIGVIFRNSLSPGLVGLAVVNSLRLTHVLNAAVHTATDLETNTVAVERIKEYCDVEPEAAWTSNHSSTLGKWPQEGRIEFKDYGLRYRDDLELTLKNITVIIQKSEKVGIVGRTGAGKSSFTLGLFRMIEPATGQIYIDGIDISKIGLHELRSKITIIPQEPILFLGSLRMNLDPFDRYTDEELWTALELAHLKSFVMTLPEKLDHECSEGGENLSVGQRQLVCLARALLRKSKILVLDEATAAVDLETDHLIQSTIRIQFKDCTVIAVAHRLNTIMDYSRIIVFDQGRIVEYDTPANLLEKKGLFYSMAKDASLIG